MNGNSAKFYDKAYSEIGSVLRERRPLSTPYRTSAPTGRKKEVRKKIFNGGQCAKESPIYIAGPRYHRKPTSDC